MASSHSIDVAAALEQLLLPHLRIHTTPSKLRDASLAPATLRAYTKQLDNFLKHSHCSLSRLLRRPPRQIDDLLSSYIEHLFASAGSYEYATQALHGLVHVCPGLQAHLGEARLRLRGWRRLKKSVSHPPLTWELTTLFAVQMARWGRHAEAVATLLAFDCYLRVGELTRITYADVVQPSDVRLGVPYSGMMVRLGVTKTGENQSVELQSKQVQTVLMHYLQAFPFLSAQRIFPFTPDSFRHTLRDVATALGMGDVPYVPHSLRHGGATFDFLCGATVEQIMFRGRWASMKSAKRYVQTCRAQLIIQRIPQRIGEQARTMAPHIDTVLSMLLDHVRSRTAATFAHRIRLH